MNMKVPATTIDEVRVNDESGVLLTHDLFVDCGRRKGQPNAPRVLVITIRKGKGHTDA